MLPEDSMITRRRSGETVTLATFSAAEALNTPSMIARSAAADSVERHFLVDAIITDSLEDGCGCNRDDRSLYQCALIRTYR
jgi:hypothetical protein